MARSQPIAQVAQRPARGTLLVGLFVPHGLVEMRALLERCVAAGWRVELLLGYEGATAGAVADWAAAHGAGLHRLPTAFAYGGTYSEPAMPRLIKALPSLPGRMARLAWTVRTRTRHKAAVKPWLAGLLDRVRPDIMLTHNFRSCGHPDYALLRGCVDRGVPTACVVVSPMTSRQISYMSRPAQYHTGLVPEHYRVDFDPFNRLMARLKPEWIAWDGDLGIFHVHPADMLAARFAGLLPKDVWQVPSDEFDVIFAPTERSRGRLLECGHAPARVRCAGMPRMEEAVRLRADQAAIDAMYRQLDLPSGSPFVLWNMEPSWEHEYSTAEVHWERVARIRARLEQLGRPVVISLHPLCKLDDYTFLEATPNIHISRAHGIHLLYPFAAFSVSFGCSTDQFAEAAGKPVLFYDWTGISSHPGRWAEFQVAGMRVATDFAQLDTLVGEMAEAIDWDSRMRALAQVQETTALMEQGLSDLAAAQQGGMR